MTDQPSYIAKPSVLKPAEDFYRLRQEGISFIEEMGTELWTDYNTHDPGITILEALCYGITELAYRTGWDIKDILTPDPAKKKVVSATAGQQAPDKSDTPYIGQYFPSAREILTVNPVTTDDFRRLLIDHKDVRNAWVTEGDDNNKKISGLYDVLIELEDDDKKDIVFEEIKKMLNSHRNLCEDFDKIETVTTADIAVCAEIDLRPDADINSVYEHILLEIENYLNPPIPFQTLDELVQKKEKIEAIFNGPQVENGFIQAEELNAASLKEKLYLSDIINILMDIEGMISIRCLRLINEEKDGNNKWEMSICGKKKIKLCLEKSNFVFYKNGFPSPRQNIGEDRLIQLRREAERGKSEFSKQDIPIPTGTFRNLNEYFPVQYSLPTAYGIGPDGLPAQASDERRARAKQLQGYLMPFEQILANAFSQLEHVGDLFSLSQKETNSYAVKEFDDEIISGIEEIFNSINEFSDLESESGKDIDCMAQCPIKEKYEVKEEQDCIKFWNEEASQEHNAAVSYARKTIDEIFPEYNQQERRNRFFDHLLARFGERFDDYRILNQAEDKITLIKDLIEDKISFIKIQQKIGSDRAKSFDYTRNNGNYLECKKSKDEELYVVTDSNTPEVKKRVSLLLGCPNFVFFWYNQERFELKKGEKIFLKSDKISIKQNCFIEKTKEIIRSISNQEKLEIKGNNNNFVLQLTLDDKIFYSFTVLCKNEKEAKVLNEDLLRWSIFQRAIVVEHILLCPKSDNEKNFPFPEEEDIYSSRLTFVIPGWHRLDISDQADRENFITMRDFTERIIRQETPAHLFVDILWVDKDSFSVFETAWYNWLKAGAEGSNKISEHRFDVLNNLCKLKNIYPDAVLDSGVRLGKIALKEAENRPKRLGEIVLKDKRPSRLSESRFGEIVLENDRRLSRLGEIVLDKTPLNKGA